MRISNAETALEGSHGRELQRDGELDPFYAGPRGAIYLASNVQNIYP